MLEPTTCERSPMGVYGTTLESGPITPSLRGAEAPHDGPPRTLPSRCYSVLPARAISIPRPGHIDRKPTKSSPEPQVPRREDEKRVMGQDLGS